MNKPLVSFVVPCYMFEKYIEKCIESIYEQKMDFDFEVLVRDDNSPDETKTILSNLNLPNLKILDGSVRLGIYGNIKTLIESADGKYITYIDGDDFFGNPFKTKLQIEFLERNPDFVMHSTSYKQIFNDGTTNPPEPDYIFLFSKDVITIEDMIQDNWGGYGRTFRNIKGIVKPYFESLPYFDWPLNYELSKHGKIKQDNFFGGYYRVSDEGLFTLLDDNKKVELNQKVRTTIKKDYSNYMSKSIVIIDSFISSDKIKVKLENCVDSFKSKGFDVFLISNTIVPTEIVKKVDFYFYNHRNLLFKKEYDNVLEIDFWEATDKFVKHEFERGLQRHGLSVLINLNTAVQIVKSLGYEFFHRVEVDDLFSPSAMDFVSKVKDECLKQNKKALFYYNEKDVSFHYFFSEVNFFLDKVDSLKDEEDYVSYLKRNGHKNNFLIAEEYIYDNLKKKGDELVLIRNGSVDMNHDFQGTLWNTETSESNIPTYYEGATTKIYRYLNKMQEITNQKIIFTKCFRSGLEKRSVVLFKDGQAVQTLEHHVDCKECWCYNIVDNNFDNMKVYSGDKLLYEVENKSKNDYINFL